MARTFKASLAVLAIALLASSALAFSPTWSTVPDVIIGNCEDGLWFFTDAFNFHDYVSDADSTSANLRLAFFEGPEGGAADVPTEVRINLKNESLNMGDWLNPPPAQELSNGGTVFTASFSSDVGAGADRDVWMVASDTVTTPAVSNAFRVRAIDTACDELTSEFACGIDIALHTTDGDWATYFPLAFVAGGFPGPAPTTGIGGGSFTFSSTGGDGAIGLLDSSGNSTPIAASTMYQMRATVRNSAASNQPTYRQRIFMANNAEATVYEIPGNDADSLSSVAAVKTSYFLPHPANTGDIKWASDHLDFNPASGASTTSIDEIDINACNVPTGTLVHTHDAGADTQFSSWIQVLALGSPTVTFAQTADAITLNAPSAGAPNSFTLTDSAGNGPTAAADQLYMGIVTLSSTQTQADQPQTRARLPIGLRAGMIVLNTPSAAAPNPNMPDADGEQYYVLTESLSASGTTVNVGYDVLHFDALDSGAMVLERVEIYEVPAP
jgi:hypothetical protein